MISNNRFPGGKRDFMGTGTAGSSRGATVLTSPFPAINNHTGLTQHSRRADGDSSNTLNGNVMSKLVAFAPCSPAPHRQLVR